MSSWGKEYDLQVKLAQKANFTFQDIFGGILNPEEFFNHNHGKGGLFVSSGGNSNGSRLNDKYAAHQDTKGLRDLLEYEIAESKRDKVSPKDLAFLHGEKAKEEAIIAKSRQDLFNHIDNMKKEGGFKNKRDLRKEAKASQKRLLKLKDRVGELNETKWHPDNFITDPSNPKYNKYWDPIMHKVEKNHAARDYKDETEYFNHVTKGLKGK